MDFELIGLRSTLSGNFAIELNNSRNKSSYFLSFSLTICPNQQILSLIQQLTFRVQQQGLGSLTHERTASQLAISK